MRILFGFVAMAAVLAAQTPQDDKRLVFSTFQGGDRNDDAVSVAVDNDGFIYVAGETESSNLAATPLGGKPLTGAVFKAYLAKYKQGGKETAWRLLIGGGSNTVPHAITLDREGNIYLVGTTGAQDLPLMNAVQTKQTGLNIAFLMKFDPTGKLLFSTYFGGERNEEGLAIALDSKGSIYIAGRATSTTLPVKNALQDKMAGGGQDGFIAKYTADYKLEYATYLGGTSGTDNIYSIAVGSDDALYVTGETMSPGLNTPDAWISKPPSYSSFVAKLKSDGSALEYFTYLGHTSGYTRAESITVDGQGRAYVTGNTTAKQMPTTADAIQPKFAGGFRDAFLVRLNNKGTAAEYLTYLGGSFNGSSDPDETAAAVKVDGRGHVYVAGETSSADFPGKRALQSNFGGVSDAYLLKLDLEKKLILSSTFWGGSKKDAALAMTLGPGENVTVVGSSYSADLPLLNAAQQKLGSANDAFVMQSCDPWLWASSSAMSFGYTRGSDKPAMQTVDISSGCVHKFDAVEISSDQSWLAISSDAKTVPLKLTLTSKVDDLEPGEYKAVVKVRVAEAYYDTIEVPVTLTVLDPPPTNN